MDKFWINPLGLDNITNVDGATDTIDYNGVVFNLKVALRQIKDLKEFLIKEYHIDPDSIISQRQSFLKVDLIAIKNVNTSFKEMYHTLQKFGAFLYYILKKANNAKYKDLLNKTKENMIQILCGIQSILLVSGQEPHSDYTYEDFLQIIKDGRFDETGDFVLMSDYENFLNIIPKYIVKSKSQVQEKRKNSNKSIGNKKAKR